MPLLTELSSANHADLKVRSEAIIEYAQEQHVLHLSASELANAASCFPIFVTRNNHDGDWAFSAMTSFTVGQNLFVEANQWQPVFQPVSMRTYPLYLMQKPDGSDSFCIGFDEQSDAFSEIQGKPLFESSGNASEHLSTVSQLLENQIKDIQSTYLFAQKLETLGLLKSIDLQVIEQGGQVNTIKGLHTINEDALRTLSKESLSELNEAGYLMPIHALLLSIFQINVLINKHNMKTDGNKVANVKMEVSKAFSHI